MFMAVLLLTSRRRLPPPLKNAGFGWPRKMLPFGNLTPLFRFRFPTLLLARLVFPRLLRFALLVRFALVRFALVRFALVRFALVVRFALLVRFALVVFTFPLAEFLFFFVAVVNLFTTPDRNPLFCAALAARIRFLVILTGSATFSFTILSLTPETKSALDLLSTLRPALRAIRCILSRVVFSSKRRSKSLAVSGLFLSVMVSVFLDRLSNIGGRGNRPA